MTPTTLYFIVQVTIAFMLCKNLGDMSSNLSTVSEKSYGEAKTSTVYLQGRRNSDTSLEFSTVVDNVAGEQL